VAIARALANHPKILIADEPTGNLDPHTSELVFNEFKTLAKEKNVAALIATHNMDLAQKMSRQVYLKDGVLV
jgi:lipoprotein-releasing system ATP-binding protein